MSTASVFDTLAVDYDDSFSRGTVGSLMRAAVWRRVDPFVRAGTRALDLGCGTGVDAVHLASLGASVVGVDASTEMLARAASAVASAGFEDRIALRVVHAQRLDVLGGAEPFDLVLSDFGVLNCTPALGRVAAGLAALTRPGARLFLCVMGPLVPWEWAWFLSRGEVRPAFRRLRPGGAHWRGARVFYPSLRRIRRAFAPGFRLVGTYAIGALLPPPFAEAWAIRHPSLLGILNRLERRLERVPPLPSLADHRLLELVGR